VGSDPARAQDRGLGPVSYWAELEADHPDPTRAQRVGSALVPVREIPAALLTGALCEEWYACPGTDGGDVFTDADAVILYSSAGGSLVAHPVCGGCLPTALATCVAQRPQSVTDVRVLRGVRTDAPT
jgi:hypothetical protein